MATVTWQGVPGTSSALVHEQHAAAAYSPLFTLRGHQASVNGVSFFIPTDGDDGAEEGCEEGDLFSTPLAVSCDANGVVRLWDLTLRREAFAFQPLAAARAIKARRIASAVDDALAEEEAAYGLAHGGQGLPAGVAAETIARVSGEMADDDMRPLPNESMNGVLSASILTVRSVMAGAEGEGDEGPLLVDLPVLVTQTRSQKLYFWLVECDEAMDALPACSQGQAGSDGGGGSASHDCERVVGTGHSVRLIHEVKVGQLGFCSALCWVGAAPRDDDSKTAAAMMMRAARGGGDQPSSGAGGGCTASSSSAGSGQTQCLVVAAPEDNNGGFAIQRFAIVVDLAKAGGRGAVRPSVVSIDAVTVADFKCGQAMCASLHVPGAAHGESPLLVVGYESGHVVAMDSVTHRVVASGRVFPDPVTSVRVVPTSASATSRGALSLIVGSAEGQLQHASLPCRDGSASSAAGGLSLAWSHKGLQGMGCVAIDGALLVGRHGGEGGGPEVHRRGATGTEGVLVIVCGWDGQVRLLDGSNGAVITNLVHHNGSVASVAVVDSGSPAGAKRFAFSLSSNLSHEARRSKQYMSVFATAGADKSIAVWVVEW